MNKIGISGNTELHLAAIAGSIDLVEQLLATGNRPDVVNDFNAYPDEVTSNPAVSKLIRGINWCIFSSPPFLSFLHFN